MNDIVNWGDEKFPELAPVLGPIIKVVAKKWGAEYWIVNNDKYCLKVLQIKPLWMCSKHRHKIKDETFLVVAGEVLLEFENHKKGNIMIWPPAFNDERVMIAGESHRIEPDTVHRFRSTSRTKPATVIEISTTHDDADVQRFEESHHVDDYWQDNTTSPSGIIIPDGHWVRHS